MRIAIVGASGFIGSRLISSIDEKYEIVGLSRSLKDSKKQNITWRQTDLFSLASTIAGLKDCDIAIYLVHSMLPATKLFQGSFYDTDLILADNFMKACKINGIKQIIYLGGVIPDGHLSSHLKSRFEVEEVLTSSKVPSTILRAGLVVGNNGSSYEILKNLCMNLPGMILPRWTKGVTPIIYIDDLVSFINNSINDEEFKNKTFNLMTGEGLTYKDLIKKTVKKLGKWKILIPIPINYLKLSKSWVSYFGMSTYSLVSPLIDSLVCDFSKLKPNKVVIDRLKFQTYDEMLGEIVFVEKERKPQKIINNNNVRSIQRLAENSHLSARDVANEYMSWLPLKMRNLIHVKNIDEEYIEFKVLMFGPTLLKLRFIESQTEEDRVKFHVIGGLLTKTTDTGWLEFRNINNGRYILASINEFYPALPWYIYKYTQAIAHKLTMDSFGKYLRNK